MNNNEKNTKELNEIYHQLDSLLDTQYSLAMNHFDFLRRACKTRVPSINDEQFLELFKYLIKKFNELQLKSISGNKITNASNLDADEWCKLFKNYSLGRINYISLQKEKIEDIINK